MVHIAAPLRVPAPQLTHSHRTAGTPRGGQGAHHAPWIAFACRLQCELCADNEVVDEAHQIGRGRPGIWLKVRHDGDSELVREGDGQASAVTHRVVD